MKSRPREVHRTSPQGRASRKLVAAVIATMSSLSLVACGLGTGGGFSPTGELAGEVENIELDGLSIAVGSKMDTEQILLGKMAVILFQSAGADVSDLTNIPGSVSARQAQITGNMDFMFEYTGTAWITYMGETVPIPDTTEQYEAVRDVDLAENDLVWLPPSSMNNTYGMAMKRENAEEYGIQTLEDVNLLPEDQQTFCVDAEFNARNDGFGPMLDAYGIAAPEGDRLSIIDPGAIYSAVDGGTCMIGEIYTTDGRIPALDLQILEDNLEYFPKYNMAPVIHKETLDQYPQIADLVTPITADLTNEKMQQLNAQVDVDGREPADVAYDYLVELGVIR